MDINWTKHLTDPDEKLRFESSLRGSKDVLDRLREILTEKGKDIERVELSLTAYGNPNWAYRQAHINGYLSCLMRLTKLIDLDQEDNNERLTRPKYRTTTN